ncbi:MAG: PAS domain S-box protein [Nitrosomonadales bacterium]|nr:PAS domain S-box protein [Nitrosomonadales bacterium]
MKVADLPKNEELRLEALNRYQILDTPPEPAFDKIVELAAYICKTPIAVISLVDRHRQWFKAIVGLDAHETSRDLAFCAHTILQDDAFVVTDASVDERFADNPLVTDPPKIRFYAGFPLTTSDGFKLGTLCVIDRVPRTLNREELDALRTLTDEAMSQMELRLSVRQVEQYASKLHHVETMQVMNRELMRSKIRYQQMFDNAASIAFLIDPDNGHIVDANAAAADFWGYSREELRNLNIAQINTAPREEIFRAMSKVKGNLINHLKWDHRLKNGEIRNVEVYTGPLFHGGKTLIYSILHDITERTAVEAQLKAEKQFSDSIINGLPGIFYMLDQQGRFVRWNQRFQEVSGYSAEELAKMAASDLFEGEDQELIISRIRQAFESGIASAEAMLTTKNGKKLPYYFSGQAMRVTGTDYLIGLGSDIAHQLQVQQALEESETRYRTIVENAPVGIILVDLGNRRILESNQTFQEMLGYSSQELRQMSIAEFMPEEDSKKLKAIEDIIRSGVDSYHLEKRCIHRMGKPFWIHLSVNALPTSTGQVRQYIGIVTDIDEIKRAEESLKLAASVYESSSEGMLVADADNNIIAINPAFSRVTGYAANEVVGKNPRLLSSGRQDKTFYQKMWQTLLSSGHWQGEIVNRRKDGELYVEWLTINTIFGTDGLPHRRVGLFSDITEKKKSEEVIWQQANYDPLTQLPNRRMFHDRLEQEIKKARRTGAPLALFFIDLDHFKEVNDTLGHQVGDTLLIEAAQRIQTCVRETDTVARLGGDEFTIILPAQPDLEHIERIAQNIVAKLAEPYHLGEETAFVSASLGITFYPNDAQDADQLIRNADQAMYEAKSRGRNRCNYYTHSLQESALNRLRLINDLRGALAAGQLHVYFQPIVELKTGRIYKAEALLRWVHPTRGMIPPAEFIPLAEEVGLINEIGDWVFRESTKWARRWQGICPEGFQISVNNSPLQLMTDSSSKDAMIEQLSAPGLPRQSMAIEITEGMLLHENPTVLNTLLKFRDAGVQVVIDDFGTGYSALSYLKKFDIDYLKIDQAFVRNLETEPDDLALSEAIIVMAHKLGMKVIAEGIETEAQRDILHQAGCNLGQGFLFSHPIPAEEFEKLLRSGK